MNSGDPGGFFLVSLDLALHRNRQSPQCRFVQLASVREDGRPAVRTVVFRGFLGETNRLTFATDGRSVKAHDLERTNRAEACWYFHATREQFRLAGTVTLVGADHHDRDRSLAEARLETWRGMSDESRLTYTWPDPGQPREPRSLSPLWLPTRSTRCPTSVCWCSRSSRSIISSSRGIPSTAGGTLEIRPDAGRGSRSIP